MASVAPAPFAPLPALAPAGRLVLRADGGPTLGLGHVVRLRALADIVGDQFTEVIFAIRAPAAALHADLAAAGLTVWALPEAPLAAEAAALASRLARADVLVLDGYGFDFAYQTRLRPAVAHLVCLDDLHTFPSAADLVLNPAGGVTAADYDLRQPGAHLLAGPAVAPLRAAFWAPTEPTSTAEAALPDTVLLCLGGADPRQLTQQAAAQLLALPQVAQVHVVVGSAYAGWPALSAWAAGHADRLHLHRNVAAPALAALMRRCGVALCSPSTVSYEYCAAGGGLLFTLPTADNQYDLDHYLRGAGLALPSTSLGNVLTTPEAPRLAAQMRARQRQQFDGLAPARLRQAFRALRVPAAPLHLRPVVAADSDQLLAWANEPETRRQSFNPAPVSVAEHEAWFAAQLANPRALLLLAEAADTGEAAGLVRFAVAEASDAATLSYSLAPSCRGRGWAAPLLLAGTRAALARFPDLRRVRGAVRRANPASLRAFQRAGFAVESETVERVEFVWVA